MQKNIKIETAALTGIVALYMSIFLIYASVLKSLVNFIIHLPVSTI